MLADPAAVAAVRRRAEGIRCRRSFAEFAARFWSVVAARPLEPNLATEAVCAALQAVADRRIRNLVIELPPGVGKTSLLSLYVAWRIARDPAHRTLVASHSFQIAVRGVSRRARRVVEDEAYRALFGVELRPDENTMSAWATTGQGSCLALGVDGGLTGARGNEFVIDDSLNAPDAGSSVARGAMHEWFVEGAVSRVDAAADGTAGSIVVVGQRLHVDDLPGRLRRLPSWRVLCLAAEHDPERDDPHAGVLVDDEGVVVWEDPRTEKGDLLAPTVISPEVLTGKPDAVRQCQYNQNPASDAGAAIKRANWRFYGEGDVPSGCDGNAPRAVLPARFDRVVVAADLTFGAQGPDASYAAVQAWGARGKDRFLLRRWRKRCGTLEQDAVLKDFARCYPGVKILIETKAHGPAAIERLEGEGVPGVVGVPALGSKTERLGLVEATVDSGCCYLPAGDPDLGEFTEELAGATRNDDQSDVFAYAVHELNVRGAEPSAEARHEAQTRGLVRAMQRIGRRR